ncbi:cucurbitadienol 11-hydroxylase-like [Eucalyptus grandis]|uniref:cucurbitadienol 11-hydroxylase-like n=1 Tax=Eucalyptus grandis TaxID=71139 RepID=UPI00192EFBA8|nr:cucurbitadienol 11-hydroxylase-like [Eucalyptus grandis]
MMFPMLEIAMGLAALIVFAVFHWKLKWRNRSNIGKLPPGSMGLPYIGETIQFFIPSRSRDMPPFIKKRVKKYGTLFKTSLAGRPVVVSSDPEFNKFVLLQEGKSVETWYLDSFSKLVGHDTQDLEVKTNATGYIHKHLRYLILNHMGSESLKKMIFKFTSKLLLGYDAENSGKNVTEDFHTLMDGLMSLPINIPGTAFHKSLKSQEKLLNMIRRKIAERMAAPADASHTYHCSHGPYTSYREPKVLQELIKENQEALHNRRISGAEGITWEEYKSMPYTLHVVNESLRLASNIPGVMRRAIKDIEWNGYVIPKGWTIVLSQVGLHLNPEVYEDPLAFNPSRWEQMDRANVVGRYYIPFGGGGRPCAGAEFTRAFCAVFLQVFVTKYRWTKVRGGEIIRTPFKDWRWF